MSRTRDTDTFLFITTHTVNVFNMFFMTQERRCKALRHHFITTVKLQYTLSISVTCGLWFFPRLQNDLSSKQHIEVCMYDKHHMTSFCRLFTVQA